MIKRKYYSEKINSGFDAVPIVVLIGARQVGKTSLMKMHEFEGKSLFLNGQDPETYALFQKLSQLEAYLKIYLDQDLQGLLLIDEFQFIPGVSTMLKLLTDKYEHIKILCSGSSSLDILQTVEESLAGRVRVIEVFSLSFSEYILFNDENLYRLYESFDLNTPDTAIAAPLIPLLGEYLVYGGLPRAALNKGPEQKLAILDDIYKTYLLRDVRSYIRNEHFIGFNKLLRMLALQIGNLVNINELSRESGLPYRACADYIELLQQMYIIKLIEPYITNKRSVIGKMKKVFFCDTGIRNMINADFGNIEFRSDKGAIFENYVLLELWRNLKPGGSIRFYRTSDGVEVDFVVNQVFTQYAIECKYRTLDKPLHSKALIAFSDQEGIDKRFVVNRNLNVVNRNVRFIQAYLVDRIGENNPEK
ncbi:MAG: ATP-binding protein [Bacteroidales bacterium]|nr:ATP-binding protein [Bacteroidales bacterium]MDZ4203302.1 ATP-binding protein [Bacteroidales bacterium]